jgi:hypothetical protein
MTFRPKANGGQERELASVSLRLTGAPLRRGVGRNN